MFKAIAEFERALINERTSKGREKARERGKLGGRPRTFDAKKVALVKKLHAGNDMGPKEIADAAQVSVSTMSRLLRMEEAS
ncbi:recombinase family protein [Paeniglutamicibacter sp. MACA_103]|uniref:recombinase family protein n=1 Tax=Paeniglutamicibacter sp. MACA_103 TaxID=3377337 RepID=UPI003893F862